jgi:hypothetical protein
MSKLSQSTRRSFLKKAITGAIITGVPSGLIARPEGKVHTLEMITHDKKFSANDQVNIAVIGMGIMGFNNLGTSVKIPGVKLNEQKRFTERIFSPQRTTVKYWIARMWTP